MVSPIWNGFSTIKEMVTGLPNPVLMEKVDSIVAAVMEAIADALPTASAPLLREGAMAARDALETLERVAEVDDGSPSYTAGRLAAAVDVLGYASFQTADDAILERARMQPFGRILQVLAEQPLRNVDLAARLGKDEARTSKWLTELRELGAVTSHKQGREVFSALTPIGRLVVEQGWQDERRAPLDASNVIDMGASRFDLARRAGPPDAERRGVPRISASGG